MCLQEGHTALHLAVRRCQVEVVRCLLRHRCQVDQQDRHGNTPLHIACKDGNLPVVMAICNAKASLDLPNKVSASTSPPDGPDTLPEAFPGRAERTGGIT